MANRRMFAKSITGSARFLRMPVSARLLYYDLGMQADDEGVVEAFPVMRMTGAAEDDLRVLAAKSFITVVNDDLVSIITDWKENNYIQKDRFTKSIYHDIVERIQNGYRTDTKCIQDVHGMETQVRLGQDRLVQGSTGKGSGGNEPETSTATDDDVDVQHINGYVSSYINLSPTALEELTSFREDGISDEVIKYAVDSAIDNNKRTWSYVKAILNRCVEQGYKTIADVRAAEAEREKMKNSISAKQAKNTKADLNYQHHEYTDSDFEAPKRTEEEETEAYQKAYEKAMLKYMGG